jgi:hypothetical protein
MNWGNKIALVYGGFAAFIISLVVLCARQTDIHLVSPDYYKEEIAYQNQIDQLSNAHHLKEKLQFHYEAQQKRLQLHFPASTERSGEILFFRPSDARKDLKMDIRPDAQGNQAIPVGQLDKGLWKVKIHWQAGQQQYLAEETLVIQ